MLWKIYFWILLVLSLVSLTALFKYEIAFIDFLSFVHFGFLLIATYSYAFKKQALSPGSWSVVFAILIIWSLLDLIAINYPPFYDVIFPFLKSKISPTLTYSDYWFGLLLILPSAYACYQLSSFAAKKVNFHKKSR